MSQNLEDNRKKWPGGEQSFNVGGKEVDSKKIWENPSDYDKGGEYGKVWTQTFRSGHSIEVDSTPGGERFRIISPNGSYLDMQHDGTNIFRANGSSQEVVVKDRSVRVKGAEHVQIDGDAGWKVGGDVNWQIGGDFIITVGGKTEFKTDFFHVVGAAMSHNSKDVGDTHRHHDVMPGPSLTGVPTEGKS